ncbi:MAG TPA: hypothetical protein VEJ84_03690, partial [Acidimicrobiales bacterium]|nr:hypothetical protein [Acidimicrobiales bacterium]
FAFEKCVEEPPFIELQQGHKVACWKAMQDVAQKAALQPQARPADGPAAHSPQAAVQEARP